MQTQSEQLKDYDMQLIEKDEQIQIQQTQISNLENMCLQLKCKNKKFEIENLGM